MDNTTESIEKCAFAQVAYAAICGAQPAPEAQLLSIRFAQRMFDSPWKSLEDEGTRVHGERFFTQLTELGDATDLKARWRNDFDSSHSPSSPKVAHRFISDFMSELAHFPRHYHDFVCQRVHVDEQSVMDFPITHPIAVEFWAIYCTVDGSAELTINGQVTFLSKGSVAIVPPGCNCTISRANQATSWTYHELSFRSKLEWLELLNWATELTTPTFLIMEGKAEQDLLLYQTEQLESTSYQPNSLEERLCNNMIENFLIRLRMAAEADTDVTARVDRRIQAAVTYILGNFQQDLGVEELAQVAHLSPSRLSALFRQHYGISLIKWRDHIRMQKAKELIRLTALPIAEIATKVGYADPLYFSRRFRSHTGVAPSEFR